MFVFTFIYKKLQMYIENNLHIMKKSKARSTFSFFYYQKYIYLNGTVLFSFILLRNLHNEKIEEGNFYF